MKKPPLEAIIEDTPMRAMRDTAHRACSKPYFRIVPAGALVAALTFASTAQAQLLNPFRGYSGPVMNDQDRKLARTALQTLLDEEPATVGKTTTWSNPADGRHGSMTMSGTFHRNGMDCRTVEASASFPQRTNPRQFTFRLCRTPSGQWRMLD